VTDEHDIDEAARVLVNSRYVIALVGAGISVESGIRPFRGKGGLWTEKGEPPMDGYQRFMQDPATAWRELLQRRASDDDFSRSLTEAVPNEGHFAMAKLEQIGVLRHTISQNIDNLHFIAGQRAVTEIHGNRTKVRCVDCGARWPWAECDLTDVPPRCTECGGVVKSDTVMFGEPIPRAFLAECSEQAERADCVLLAGTSATVYPAAMFAELVLERGGAIVEVNTDRTPFTPYATAVLRGASGELLPPLVAKVEEMLAARPSG
jgi:NAD-dependent deacetylase